MDAEQHLLNHHWIIQKMKFCCSKVVSFLAHVPLLVESYVSFVNDTSVFCCSETKAQSVEKNRSLKIIKLICWWVWCYCKIISTKWCNHLRNRMKPTCQRMNEFPTHNTKYMWISDCFSCELIIIIELVFEWCRPFHRKKII